MMTTQDNAYHRSAGTNSHQVPYSHPQSGLSSPHLRAVQSHYRDTIEDYQLWSPEGNLHFGYWRWGVNPLSRPSMLAEMNRQVLGHLRIDRLLTGTVADLGCGVGAVSRFGAHRYPNLQWHAVNVSSRQIEEARRVAQGERIEYHCRDYHQLPWQDCSIDGAFFVESLCYSLNPTEVINEVARVLRPGARLVITDGYLMRPLQQTSRFFRTLFGCVSRNWAVPSYHQIGDVDSWLTESGMQQIVCQELGWRLAPTAIQSVPLSIYCALKFGLRRERNLWRWKQLYASSLSLMLGLQRRNFRYYMVVLEKRL